MAVMDTVTNAQKHARLQRRRTTAERKHADPALASVVEKVVADKLGGSPSSAGFSPRKSSPRDRLNPGPTAPLKSTAEAWGEAGRKVTARGSSPIDMKGLPPASS